MTRIFFDIETGPLPESQLAAVEPDFCAPRNLRDPAKIQAAIDEKRVAWREGAALSAMTGQVLAIGWLAEQGGCALAYQDSNAREKDVIVAFWSDWESALGKRSEFLGWYIHSFDLPFLVQRSWLLGIKVPPLVRGERYWSERFVDLALLWNFGDRNKHVSLDAVCKAFGIGEKLGHGKDFASLFATDREAALAYLETDVRLTAELWRRMQ